MLEKSLMSLCKITEWMLRHQQAVCMNIYINIFIWNQMGAMIYDDVWKTQDQCFGLEHERQILWYICSIEYNCK